MRRTSSTVITFRTLAEASDNREPAARLVALTRTAKPGILLYVSGIISRPAEQQAVVDFLDSTSQGPSALLMEGGGGIGKTTLCLHAVDQAARRRLRVLTTRPAEAESVVAYSA